MPRVIGIDPGTISIDVCGVEDGRVFLDTSLPTRDALADPRRLIGLLEAARPLDLVAGPSGYGLPLVRAADMTEQDLRLAYLAAPGEGGGIGGLRPLLRALADSALPIVFTPGVVHLGSVPAFRKINRVDMGTADKVCAAALAIDETARRTHVPYEAVSCILLELGGAFSAALAIHHGCIVDGMGGTCGPLGLRAAGALDGEVAYLAGTVSKAMLFQGGAASAAGLSDDRADELFAIDTPRARAARDAMVESAAKAVAALAVTVPGVRQIVLSGRLARRGDLQTAIAERVAVVLPAATVGLLEGFAAATKHAAQGAALVADGLAGGQWAPLVETMRLREASGSVVDHLHVVSPAAARVRLGLEA